MKQLESFKEVNQDLFQKIADHEQVVFCNDPLTGLKAIIAIHDTTLGPALGGTRMYPYPNMNAALEDVLRLSEGMTAKCAACDVDFGGGKAVIIGDPKTDKSPALFRAFGQLVDSLNGRFYTGTDMGTTMEDFVHAAKETNFISGIPEDFGGSGDSSIPTAQGVIYSLKATNQFLYGSNDISGKVYAIQGLGKVGRKIAETLIEEGAEIYVTDVNEKAVNEFLVTAKLLGGFVHIVKPEEIYQVEADVFMPCAIGGVINEQTIPKLKVKAIVGSANNQLAHPADAYKLYERGILYAPDYIVNAGGLIQVADELYGVNKKRVLLKTKNIYEAIFNLYKEAQAYNITTVETADRRLKQHIETQQVRNSFYSQNRKPKWNIKK